MEAIKSPAKDEDPATSNPLKGAPRQPISNIARVRVGSSPVAQVPITRQTPRVINPRSLIDLLRPRGRQLAQNLLQPITLGSPHRSGANHANNLVIRAGVDAKAGISAVMILHQARVGVSSEGRPDTNTPLGLLDDGREDEAGINAGLGRDAEDGVLDLLDLGGGVVGLAELCARGLEDLHVGVPELVERGPAVLAWPAGAGGAVAGEGAAVVVGAGDVSPAAAAAVAGVATVAILGGGAAVAMLGAAGAGLADEAGAAAAGAVDPVDVALAGDEGGGAGEVAGLDGVEGRVGHGGDGGEGRGQEGDE